MIKVLSISLSIAIILSLNGCGGSSSSQTKHLDELRRLSEGTHNSEYGTTLQSISYDNEIFKFSVYWLGNDKKEERYSYSFNLNDLDFESMKSNSMFVKKSIKEIWINCKSKSLCLTHSNHPNRKFTATTMKIYSDDRIGFINTLIRLKEEN